MTEQNDLDRAVERLEAWSGVQENGGCADWSLYDPTADLRTIRTILEALRSPDPEVEGADLHIRADADGLRIYDGKTRIVGPWSWSEASEALLDLKMRKARAALSSNSGGR